MSLRITPPAAAEFREAVRDADGTEVFAIGDVEGGVVTGLVIAARGQHDRVLAVLGRPRHGQVVIHNHPSGDLRPSDADLSLAARYSEDGVGFVIVDSEVTASRWVVEPWQAPGGVEVDVADVERVLTEALPRAMPGWEVREAQLDMARRVTARLNDGAPLIVEAGTGTGKSLAYLVPAALWALANDAKVVIATHTRALQSQLLTADLPLLPKAGVDVRAAVLEGRTNYLCRRRLALAVEDSTASPEDRSVLEHLSQWSETSSSGSRSDLGHAVPAELWERVESDTDLSLRMRCPHYDACHFYEARRRSSSAHLVVVNHALLLADLVLRDEVGHGVLPQYRRAILDEAHHLEDVATGAAAVRLTARALRRASLPLLPRRNRPGALARLAQAADADTTLPSTVREQVTVAATEAAEAVAELPDRSQDAFDALATVLDPSVPTRAVDDAFRASTEWQQLVGPRLAELTRSLEHGAAHLDAIETAFGEHRLARDLAQPRLDVTRARRRLGRQAAQLRWFLDPRAAAADDHVRWLEVIRQRRDGMEIAVRGAPVDVGPTLQRLLWEVVPGSVSTSATLSVAGDFRFWRQRHGLPEADELVLASPFDHFEQAILGLPTDLPPPDQPGYLEQTARAIVDAVTASGGGAFVLCTSHRAVESYARVLRAALGPTTPVLAQGDAGRAALLSRFKEHADAVLVGTDSFWEGVSVKGRGLRLVVLPRMPFRVPTDPLRRARHTRIEQAGGDAFAAYTLPHAILRLRQGYGRLLRSREDRGVVLLLDTRVHQRRYGARVLAALPPARRVKGPWSRVLAAIEAFYAPPKADEGRSGE